MKLNVSLCQLRPFYGDPEVNAGIIEDLTENVGSDIYILPESFLTGYGCPLEGMGSRVTTALGILDDICRERDIAIAVGTPIEREDGWTNSLAFVSPDGTTVYDKTHLARFGIYSEDEFVQGSGPAIGTFKGLRFGLSICYDIYFPEILHGCSLKGADMNICVSAAAKPSASYFERVLPARALENVTYLAFVNNIGDAKGLPMAGNSCAYDPLGVEITRCGDEEDVRTFELDTDAISEARGIRRHLTDFRSDIGWLRSVRGIICSIRGRRTCSSTAPFSHNR